MRNRRTYESAPPEVAEAIEQAEIVTDFLPAPDQLVLREDTVKVTLNLNKKSIAFFKEKARENGVPYQSMIRKVLDLYAERFQHLKSS